MRPLVAAAALVVVASCRGGGPSTGNAPGNDPAPSSTDRPPSSYDTPPSNGDTPPSSTDTPPGQSGGNSGCSCRGTYACNLGGIEVQISLSGSSSNCTATASGGGVTLNAPVSCSEDDAGGDLPGGVAGDDAGAAGTSVTLTSSGNLKVCSDNDCVTCGGGSTTTDDDAGGGTVSVTIGGSGCSALASCCDELSTVEATGCNSVVSAGSDAACTAALQDYQGAKICD